MLGIAYGSLWLILAISGPAFSIPRRGNEPWSLVLCKFADLPNYEPKSKEWFDNWMQGEDQDSIVNYFAQVSNGVYTIYGSNVYGWYTLPYTQKDILSLANSDAFAPLGSDSSFNYFDKIKELCVEFAIANGAVLHRQKITVVNAGTTAVYGKENGVLLTPSLMFSSVLTHEMVHSFFIGHSYSDRKIRVFPYAMNGEYDDRYDLMSTANAYMHQSPFGMSGPGLNGPHLDFLGWVPMDRILYFGRDGRQNYTLRLSSLSVPHKHTRGWLLVLIPFDRMDSSNYYTIELRTSHNYDRGIAQNAVLIHRVQRSGDNYYSVLLSQSRDFYELTENTEWVTFLEPSNTGRFQMIRVTVRRIYPNDADITVMSTFDPVICRMGEIPRMIVEARFGIGYVCLDKNRPVLSSDVQTQLNRKDFYRMRTTFGANACKPGYVWRGLDAYDFVCVEMHRRQLAHAQTMNQRFLSSANGTECMSGSVHREAFIGDEVCVSPSEKYTTSNENMESVKHLEHFEFFNGVDTVGP